MCYDHYNVSSHVHVHVQDTSQLTVSQSVKSVSQSVIASSPKKYTFDRTQRQSCSEKLETRLHFTGIVVWEPQYDGASKSFRTGCLERKLQIVQISATRCRWINILWVSLVSFSAITIFVASQRVFIVVSACFVIDSVRKLLDTPSYSCDSPPKRRHPTATPRDVTAHKTST
jgi:hypothetical protein